MADKAIPDISLGGAEQNMSREELAAVTKAVATLSPEDRDLLAAVQESPFRLTTAEQFLEFEKNVDCFVLEPHVQTLEDLGWECALPGFVDSKNEEKTERNAGYLVVSQSGGGMLRQGTREGIRRTPANRGMRAHRIVKGLDISEDVCHGMCP